MKVRWGGHALTRRRLLLALLVVSLVWLCLLLYSVDEIHHQERAKEHELCVIVPFRNRNWELERMAPHMHSFLNKQHVKHKILVLNQTDSFRFNRASLINVGSHEADRLGCDYLVMHDVDLLPKDPDIDYSFPGRGIVRHISSPQYHPKYHYAKFIGGILMLTLADFRTLNGMSNKYWGWGLEDDEFYLRIRDANLTLVRVANLSSPVSEAFEHLHDSKVRKRDYGDRGKQEKAIKRKRDRFGGLSDLRYEIAGRDLVAFGDARVSVVHVRLFCNLALTPYCVDKGAKSKADAKTKPKAKRR